MSYCARCGAYIPQDEKSCLACGYRDTSASRLGSGTAAETKAPKDDTYSAYSSKREYNFENNQGEDKTVYYGEVIDDSENSRWGKNFRKNGGASRRYSSGRTDEENNYGFGSREAYRDFIDKDILENRGMAALSYFGIMFIVPLVARKNSPFVRFHLNQGISLFLARIALWALALLTGGLGTFISSLAGVFAFGCAVAGILNALRGKRKRLPIVGDFEVLK